MRRLYPRWMRWLRRRRYDGLVLDGCGGCAAEECDGRIHNGCEGRAAEGCDGRISHGRRDRVADGHRRRFRDRRVHPGYARYDMSRARASIGRECAFENRILGATGFFLSYKTGSAARTRPPYRLRSPRSFYHKNTSGSRVLYVSMHTRVSRRRIPDPTLGANCLELGVMLVLCGVKVPRGQEEKGGSGGKEMARK